MACTNSRHARLGVFHEPGWATQKSVGEDIIDSRPLFFPDPFSSFRQNPTDWERASATAERATARRARGGVSVESVYVNKNTGETLHIHDVFNPSGAQIPNHPTFQDFGKKGN